MEDKNVVQNQEEQPLTIQPESPISLTVVNVSLREKYIFLSFLERNEKFREIVKTNHGYEWGEWGTGWVKTISPSDENIEDRAAEVIYDLLSCGFIVSCLDKNIIDKALNATFKPRYPRWIVSIKGGRWDKYICIQCNGEPNEDDPIIEKDAGIMGALKSYKEPRTWYIKPANWAAIKDFSVIHKFKLSDGAKKDLKEAEEKEKQRLVVKTLPRLQKEKVRSVDYTKQKTNEIDDLLKDDDE